MVKHNKMYKVYLDDITERVKYPTAKAGGL